MSKYLSVIDKSAKISKCHWNCCPFFKFNSSLSVWHFSFQGYACTIFLISMFLCHSKQLEDMQGMKMEAINFLYISNVPIPASIRSSLLVAFAIGTCSLWSCSSRLAVAPWMTDVSGMTQSAVSLSMVH